MTGAQSPAVLILSSLYDLAADMVVSKLEAAGVPYIRLNRQALPDHRVAVDPLAPMMTVRGPVGRHVVSRPCSVWYRAPIFDRNAPGIPLSVDEQLDRTQWLAFLRSLAVFRDARWMNDPSATYMAESKPYQLAVANEIGFKVPRTLITNDVQSIEASFPADLVLKSLDSVLLNEPEHSLFTYTTILDRSCLSDNNVGSVPAIAQQVLRDKIDMRITVVGDDVFAVRILKDGCGIEGDWRVTPKDQLSYDSFQLSLTDENRCRELVRRMGLAFAAIDLVENDEGLFYIEMNPTGEWSWLVADDRPIDAAIASWLAA